MTKNTKIISASPEILYQAFTSADALEAWMAPGNMTGKVHHFDLREGGGYVMSLFYPSTETSSKGKSGGKEDRYTSRFLILEPGRKIVEAIRFDSSDPAFAGEMIMEVSFEVGATGTQVTIAFDNIPPGIKPGDNEKGTELSLEKLARYVAANG